MPPLEDPDRLAAFKDALANWSFSDYIQFDLPEEADKWIRRHLGNVTLKDIGRRMHEHVASGGEIDEVPETRSGWCEQYEYHHDLRFLIQGKEVYVETRLHYWVPIIADESWILVVNIHGR
ncbi:MAG TPA: hypothetical protein VG055_00055 [Planctomycetaceae bacterium]|jgi:hypothetical protein|nr:hypothetical protein [Planctomycetaceae bacterium]